MVKSYIDSWLARLPAKKEIFYEKAQKVEKVKRSLSISLQSTSTKYQNIKIRTKSHG